jgi:anthranilate synthase component 1
VPETAQSNFPSQEAFEAVVERCREYIHAGDCVQVVPSQRFSVPMHAEGFNVYRALRPRQPGAVYVLSQPGLMCSSSALRPKFS